MGTEAFEVNGKLVLPQCQAAGKAGMASVTLLMVVAPTGICYWTYSCPGAMMTEMRLKGDRRGSGCDWSMELREAGEIRKGTRSKQSSFLRHFRHAIVYGPEGAVEANIKLAKIATSRPSL
jgi:hypothetical protein